MIKEKQIKNKIKINSYNEYLNIFFPERTDTTDLITESAEEVGSKMAKETISHIKKMFGTRK